MEIRIDGWRKGIRFSSAHLTAELGKCERLHGHSYAIHANLKGETGPLRIVHDFTEVTAVLRKIAEELDHFILVPDGGGIFKVKKDKASVTMSFKDKAYTFPRGDCFLLPCPSTTAEDLVQYVLREFRARSKIPVSIEEVELGVDEGYGQGAWVTWKPRGGGA